MNFRAQSIESHAHEMENTSFASPLLPLEAKFSIIKNILFNGHYNRGKRCALYLYNGKTRVRMADFHLKFFAESYRSITT